MSDDYNPNEMKIIKRGVSVSKVLAAYKHFGSLRPTAKACGISKDTVKEVLKRNGVAQTKKTYLPKRASYNPKKLYSDFALWHKEHANDKDLPSSVQELAQLAGVSADTVKCYFYRRRKQAAKILQDLPNLANLNITLEDIEGKNFNTQNLLEYRYVIDRYSERAALQGKLDGESPIEVTAIIPSITIFAKRISGSNK
jgi:hypothetical protein